MILVAGATGLLGSEICRRLSARGEKVRALVRETSAPEKVEDLRAHGIELCRGDLKDRASLEAACAGVEAVISTASSTFSRQPGDSIETVDGSGQLNLVDAAKSAGIGRFLLVSFRHSPEFPFPLAEAKAQVEQAIHDLNFTVVQSSFFMEAWLSPALGFDYVNGTARTVGGGDGPISWVSFRDVAEMCVVALRSPAAERRVIEFGGPAALSLREVVACFERLSGRSFSLSSLPESELLAQFGAATDSMQKSFAALMLGLAYGDAIDMRPVLEAFNLSLTSVEDYARAVLA